jgi:hypothetical protein
MRADFRYKENPSLAVRLLPTCLSSIDCRGPGRPTVILDSEFDDLHEAWVHDLQVKESQLSTRGKRIMVPDSDHMIPFERPDTIVAAFDEVWAEANSRSTASAVKSGEPSSAK